MKTITAIILVFLLSFILFPSVGAAFNDVSLSQSSLSLQAGQTVNLGVTVPFGLTANIFGNTNTNVATGFINNNVLSIQGVSQGTTNIRVCTDGISCATVFVNVSGFTGGGSQITFSQNNLNMNVGENRSVSVFANSNFSSLFVSRVSDSSILSASISGNSLNIFARQNGFSTVSVCSNNFSGCGILNVTVGQGGAGLVFDRTNITLNIGNSIQARVVNNNGAFLYISNITNSNVASANISGSDVNIFAKNSGFTNISVCKNSPSECGTINVTVNGSASGGSLVFLTTSLVQPPIGQFYFANLSVTGGTAPYTFTLLSGSLPNGISLDTSGTISGTPNIAASRSFRVLVTDNFGRTAESTTFTLIPSGGTILGTSVYQNGSLVKDGSTIYITYKNLKSGFAGLSAFQGLGYRISNVTIGSTATLTNSNFVIGTSDMAHPWGSWIKSGATVYFVHESGLIPIADYSVFLNNGGQDRLLVEANSRDFVSKQILSIMGLNDSRLR